MEQTKKDNKPASFEEACAIQGSNPLDGAFTNGTPQGIAFNRLSVIAAAIRQGTPPSFKNTDKVKWYACHYYEAGVGFRFWYATHVYVHAFAPGGSALCFNQREDAVYFGTHFINEFEAFYS